MDHPGPGGPLGHFTTPDPLMWAAVKNGIERFCLWIWPALKPGAQEIVVHFLITVLTLASLKGIEGFVWAIGISKREIFPLFTVEDLMFYLDILAVTVINLVGVVRALKVIYRGHDHGP